MARLGDDLENKMVVDWVWRHAPDDIPSNECDVCGKQFEPSTSTWDWCCSECAEKARNHAVEILQKNLSDAELSVVEDLWEIYARVR